MSDLSLDLFESELLQDGLKARSRVRIKGGLQKRLVQSIS